uniref:HTH CENPB-type domain-containing protein n=1 Tax=Eptatretus burgeri TaxID=7764 RepID=A0A8C4RAS8_EPTBU
MPYNFRKRENLPVESVVKVVKVNHRKKHRMAPRSISRARKRLEGGDSSRWRSRREPKRCKCDNVELERLNALLFEWYQVAAVDGPVTRKMIKKKARLLIHEMNIKFAPSNKWVTLWKARYNVHLPNVPKELPKVEANLPVDCSHDFLALCKGYEKENIFAACETGLLFRDLPLSSLEAKVRNSKKGGNATDRVTVLLCCSAAGEKLDPVIVGKSSRFHSRMNNSTIPVTYESHDKAWMTSPVFSLWLEKLNNKMQLQSRKIIVFLNECLVHSVECLSNVKLAFIPSNITSSFQPFEIGIVRAVKKNYRKSLISHIILNMDGYNTALDLAKWINAIDAMMWLSDSWKNIGVSTIERCFQKCKLTDSPASPSVEDDNDELYSAVLQAMNGMSWVDFINCDAQLVTSKSTARLLEEELFKKRRKEDSDKGGDIDDIDDVGDIENIPMPTPKQCLSYLDSILQFALRRVNSDLVCKVMECQDMWETNIWESTVKLRCLGVGSPEAAGT